MAKWLPVFYYFEQKKYSGALLQAKERFEKLSTQWRTIYIKERIIIASKFTEASEAASGLAVQTVFVI